MTGAVRSPSAVVRPMDAHDQNMVEWMQQAKEALENSEYAE